MERDRRAWRRWVGAALLAAGLGAVGSPAALAKKTVITWAVQAGNPVYEERYKRVKAAFEKAHPDIEVQYLMLDDPFQEKLLTMVAAGESPDVIRIDVEALPGYVELGLLEDLTPYLKRDTADPLKGVFPAAIEGFRYKGGLYGIPRSVTVAALFYNGDLFAESGLNRPDDAWTWSTLGTAAQKLTRDGDGDGRIETWGFQVINDYPQWLSLIYSHGGNVLDPQTGQVTVNRPEVYDPLQWYASLRTQHHVSPMPGEGAGASFQNGNFGMIIMADWVVQLYSAIKGFEWDAALMPKGPKGRVTFIGGGAMGISTQSKNKEAAYKFVRYITSEPVQRVYADLKIGIPVLQKVAVEQYVGREPVPPSKRVILEMLPTARWAPATPRWRDMLAVIKSELAPVLDGKTSAREATTKMQTQLEAMLKRR